jgi:hypothetical protein
VLAAFDPTPPEPATAITDPELKFVSAPGLPEAPVDPDAASPITKEAVPPAVKETLVAIA